MSASLYMASFGTFMRRVSHGISKAMPGIKRAASIAANVASVAGPALAGLTGGTSELIAKGVQSANRMIQSA